MKCKECDEEFEFPVYIKSVLRDWYEDEKIGDSRTVSSEIFYPICPFCLHPYHRFGLYRYHLLDGTITTKEPDCYDKYVKEWFKKNEGDFARAR